MRRRLTQIGHPFLLGSSLLVAGFLYVPLLVVMLFSFNQSRLMMDWQGWTTGWYEVLLKDSRMLDSLANSLWVAFWTTGLSLLMGIPAGVQWSRLPDRLKRVFEVLLLLPLVVPEIVLGVGFSTLFGLTRIRLSFSTVIFAHVAFSLSYVVLMVRSRMRRMDRRLIDAAMDLNASESRTFFRIVLPYLSPAVVSSGLMVFIISLDDYVITSFVAGVGNTTLPLQIYSMVKEGLTPEINAVSTALLVLSGLFLLVSQVLPLLRVSMWQTGLVLVALGAVTTSPLWWQRLAGQPPAATLNLFIWSGYLAPNTTRIFEQRFNAKVRVDLYDSNEAFLAKLQAGGAGYDLVVPSDYSVQILRRLGRLGEIDRKQLPHFSNLDETFLNRPFDPANRYSVPYTWGITGIGYRKDLVHDSVKGWGILWDRKYQNRIVMLDDMRENFGAALKLAGFSINSQKREEIEQAQALLEQQKPLVRAYNSSNFQELLLSGDAWLVQGWNGQLVKAMQESPVVGFSLPEEGSTLFIDSFCIPSDAPHKALAHAFIDYMLEAETAAEIVNQTGYAVANRAARAYIKRSLLTNPALFPLPADLERCEMLEDVGASVLIYDRLWTEIKSQ
ncbi:MAG: extracellular solute-binding protein [Acidobacteriota bacterium]